MGVAKGTSLMWNKRGRGDRGGWYYCRYQGCSYDRHVYLYFLSFLCSREPCVRKSKRLWRFARWEILF